MKTMTVKFTQKEIETIRMALSVAIENDETFYVDGCKRDRQAAADYRSLLSLYDWFNTNA